MHSELRINADALDYEDGVTFHEKRPFTGTAFDLRPNGALWSEEAYELGLKHGPSRDWFESGALKSEDNYKFGLPDGFHREWYENGRMKSESLFSLGIRLEFRSWDETGRLTTEDKIDPTGKEAQEVRRKEENEPNRVEQLIRNLTQRRLES